MSGRTSSSIARIGIGRAGATADDDEDESLAPIIHYGDQIVLFDNQRVGFVTSSISSAKHAAVDVMRVPSRKKPKIGNISTAVFEILPQFKFKARKDLQRKINALRQANEGSISFDVAIGRADDPEELQNLKLLADAEDEDNRNEMKRRHGDQVLYGQVVLLYHPHSRRFVRVQSNVTSRREASNLRVDMDDFATRNSWFRIMPRYKVRAEGDPIRVTDQIVLESLKTAGQFLHTSFQQHPEDTPDHGLYEVNCSVQPTAYSIYEFVDHTRRDDEEGAAQLLRGGDTIQLFHKEISAYIAAEGVFSYQKPVEDVHMRIRPADQTKPHGMLPPTSAVTFWQVEFVAKTMSGGPVGWEQDIRLKHLPTQMYLSFQIESASNPVHVPCLTSDPNDPSCVFKFFAVIRERDDIAMDSYCRIAHKQTGYWLHAEPDRKYTRRGRNLSMPPTANPELIANTRKIRWDGAELCQLGLSETRMFDDAFIIQPVDKEYVYNVGYVAGMIPVIRMYTRLRLQGEPPVAVSNAVVSALKELSAFMFVKGNRVRERQKLIRNLYVVEMLVELLKSPFAPFNTSPSAIGLQDLADPRNRETLAVVDAAYKVLETYLRGNSRKNELYIAAHIPFFQSQVGAALEVEKMYTELVRDNNQIVHAITDKEIMMFVNLLKTDKQPQYLEFLSVLCECIGAPLPHNQDKIAKALLIDSNDSVYLTEVNGQGDGVVVSIDNGKTWGSLYDFVKSAMDEKDDTSTPEYLFLDRQLELFGKLCLGRNDSSIDIIANQKKYLTWRECYLCVTSDRLPKSLRAKYVALMIHLFIDVGDNRDVLDSTTLSYSWDDLKPDPYKDAAEDRTTAITGARFLEFAKIHNWMHGYLAKQTDIVATDKANNKLLSEVLNLLHHLVVFGYYAAPEDIVELMKPLSSVADGRNDRYAHPSKPGVTDSERRAQVLKEWRSNGRFEKNGENEIVALCKFRAMKVIELLLNLTMNARLQHMMLDFKLLTAGERDTGRQRTSTSRRRVYPNETATHHARTIKAVLNAKDDSTLYHLTDEVRAYIHDLTDASNWVTPGWHPIDTAKNDIVDVLVDLARYEYSHVLTSAMRLTHRLFSSRDDLFGDAIQAQFLLTDDSKDLAKKLGIYLPQLRRLTKGYVEACETEDYLSIVTALEKKCYVEPENPQYSHPHDINQGIIFNSGILDILFDVLSKNGQATEVLCATFRLLRAMALKNPPVQQMLFDNMGLMMNHSRTEGWHDDMAYALTEAFTQNKTLCLSVRSEHLEQIMELLRDHTCEAPNLLALLAAVVKAEELDLPLKRNQDMIVRFLMEYRDIIITPAYIDDESSAEINEKRLALLREEFPSADELKLRTYHCNIVRLLAGCAEGENKYIESMCQTIFSIEEILQVLEDDLIDPLFKGPYMEFLLWVYLNTGEASEELLEARLETELRLWDSMKRIGTESSFLKSDTPRSEELAFMLDSYVPLLSKLVKDFFVKEASPAVRRCVGVMAKAMADFGMKALSIVGDRSLVKRVATCIMLLASKSPGHVTQDTLDTLGARLTAQEAGIVDLPVVQRYYEYYLDEIQVNTEFNEFARRLRLAYGGANTMRRQLLHGVSGVDDPSNQYCEEPHEDEALPLFPEFQRELDVFCKYGEVGGVVAPVQCRLSITQLVRQLTAVLDDDTLEMDFRTLRRRTLLNCRTMQILRAILHNAVTLGAPTQRLQDDMTPAVLPVMFLLQDHDSRVVQEALAALALMLKDGHRGAQGQIQEYFLGTREELFFEVVQAKVKNAMETTTELRNLRRQLEIKTSTQEKLLGTLTLAGQLGQQVSDALGSVRSVSSQVAETIMSAQKQPNKAQPTSDLGFQDTGNMELVLRVMQLMCEGYNLTLKEYLHKQEDNIRSIDLVAETVSFFQVYIEEITEDNVPLIIQTAEALVEFAQGYPPNQAVVFDEHIVDHINFLLRFPINCHESYVAWLKHALGKLLLSLLENDDERTKQMASEVDDTLDIRAVIETMQYFYDQHTKRLDTKWYGEDSPIDEDDRLSAVEIGYTFYNVVVRLADFTGKDYLNDPHCYRIPPEVDRKGRVKNDAADFYGKQSCSIEILRDGRVHKVHFFNAFKGQLRDDDKNRVVWTVDRSSPTDKIRDFVSKCRTNIADFRYHKFVRDRVPAAKSVINYSRRWSQALLLLTLVINVVILTAWRAPRDPLTILPDTRDWFPEVLYILGGFHVFFSTMTAFSYFLVHPPSFRATISSLPFGRELLSYLPSDESERTQNSLLGAESFHHFLLIPLSVLGLLYSGYFFAYHLFHVIIGNDILNRAIRAVTKNGQSLLWVAGLLCIVVYVYSFLIFAFLRRRVPYEDGYWCDTLFQCFVTSLRFGLMNGGGLGEGLIPETFSWRDAGLRVIFDLSFFILVTIVGLNVVFGIIVDTFSELRDEKYQIEDAMENECFICSIKSHEFDRYGKGFEHHIKHEHNMWNYLYFLLYLDQKDMNDYTSHEFYVSSRLAEKEELQFFPVNRALALDHRNAEQDTVDVLREEVRGLHAKLDAVIARLLVDDASATS
ncbi:inositol 1,4,5-trisphosphate receptor type 3 [Salpingoeca rosetta]|uniref:Inositol 1,4,5-trisphosphate receptor type 3 n=1 Tax=Salpingoeca rosetta (strain ATCC 50818 / BSB-021) TaxID=946362 RepID=F2UDQ9_SALR5|nr:inositol 1,4,5-trisphosphate receptor type 3 [Salpingoeca rosetta]EGD74759.1 inositol 1,4,5-trisphosphate receptor type 3 [Salpingoeca rosetta]|eukprot:XP_004992404.1 inositol 1,4,5-trisphosphate receptor type 3 [Salpingoeca rosetta]